MSLILPFCSKESVLDSNGMCVTIAVAHMFNLLRVKDVALEERDLWHATRGWGRFETIIQMIYCACSVLETCDCHVGRLLCTPKGEQDESVPDRFTVCLHSSLVSCMVFVHVSAASVSKNSSVARCLMFIAVSIAWSYIIGVPAFLRSLQAQEERKEHDNAAQMPRVQNIVLCQLRFAFMLLVDMPYVIAFLPILLLVTAIRACKVWKNDMPMTHPEFFIHTDILVDPLGDLIHLLASAASMRNPSMPRKTAPILPLKGDEKARSESQDDTLNQFIMAKAAMAKMSS